ncbi:EAL domain-containing protein [Virgisporangium ochraceum]|uniref:Bifunctional diguanylate cyclase/phosphodiesterase n=1 Tax=Virgisporangium ochraceum TaxID=65505 RepID=A0A8J3ZKF2_9ACTN|nr:bifunctional diguanylate cyclase/phosphodiesterase [Virgisporangium ochraceum]
MVRPSSGVSASPVRAWFVTIPLAVFAASLTVAVFVHQGEPFSQRVIGPPFLVGLFCVLLVLPTFAPLHINVRRTSVTASVTEMPYVLALFYLPPLGVLLIRVVAAVAVQYVRRAGWIKGTFNVASAAACTACAIAVMVAFAQPRDLSPRGWAVLGAAVLASMVINNLGLTAIAAVVQGTVDLRQLLNIFGPHAIATCVNITLGLVTLLALDKTLWSGLLLGCLAAGLILVYRVYTRFVNQHTILAEIHEITRATTASVTEGRLADVALGRLRSMVQAESATIWMPARGRFPEVLLTATLDYRGLLDSAPTPASVRRRAFETGEGVMIGEKLPSVEDTSDLRAELQSVGIKDVIVVPLRSGSAVIGTIEVAGRLGRMSHFDRDDLRVVETLAAHIGVAVENSRLVDRLRYDANYDTLTGLPNRRRLISGLSEVIGSRTPGEAVAVIQFDVISLRSVNESLGHKAGNEVLIEVANRLRALAPAAALVARVGGDEFAVVMRVEGVDSALTMADEIRAGLREPMEFDTMAVDIDTTVGLAVHPDHGDDPELLLQRADVATHAAKVTAGSQTYNAGLESRSVRRLGLAADLRRGLASNEIEVYFQPKVALADRRVVGVECLARWEHPVYGPVTPEDFVAVAEHTGQISQLTELVLRHGLRRAREWADEGRALGVAVNVSPRSLADTRWPDQLAALLHEYGVAPERLTLEIREEVLLGDQTRSLEALRRLRVLGVRLSIDDFGTGYSSLALLRRLPINEVKIDKLFVQGMATDAADLAIVRAVVDLSRRFDLAVVAEGVESELTLAKLEEIGCDLGQGFLFSRPLPDERLDAWLAARTEAQPAKGGEVRWLRAVP